MTCAEFQSRLQTAVDNRDAAALTKLKAHGDACRSPACRVLWQEQRLFSRAVAEWRRTVPSPPADLVERVLAEVWDDQSLARRVRMPAPQMARDHRPLHSGTQSTGWDANTFGSRPGPVGRWAAITAAAGVLLAVTLFVRSSSAPDSLVRDGSSHRPSPEVTSPDVTPGPPNDLPQALLADVPNVPSSDAIDDLAATKRESYVGMAHEATYFMTDLAMLVVPVSVDEPEADGASEPDWISRLGEQLEPVEAGVKGKLGEWFGPPST
ncbi:MAG: hypothetical protein KDA75_15810 [Planctomycetaceae bacterium]|nr:hypothetical protein [Planctomycetaceae bacterium]